LLSLLTQAASNNDSSKAEIRECEATILLMAGFLKNEKFRGEKAVSNQV